MRFLIFLFWLVIFWPVAVYLLFKWNGEAKRDRPAEEPATPSTSPLQVFAAASVAAVIGLIIFVSSLPAEPAGFAGANASVEISRPMPRPAS